MICQSGPKETPGKLPHMIMLVPHSIFSSQEVMELQKDAMRGEEVGLSPCASGSARFCHMFVPTILEMGGLQILLFQELIDNGNIEELFLHEGSHVSVDSLLEVKHHFGPLFCILPKNRKISTSLFAYHHKCILT